jgi:hypothetical protein
MKKTGLLIIFLTSLLLHAQAQVSLGIRTGYTAANMEISGDVRSELGDVNGMMKTFHGWHLDLVINMPLGYDGFYLQPVIRYITKGTSFNESRIPKAELTGLYVPKGSQMKLNYLELPFNIVYKCPLGVGSITGGFGPYVGYGLQGRYDFDIMQNGRSITQNSKQVQFSRRADNNLAVVRMYPWDAGANFMLGYEFDNGIMFGVNYSMGLTDIDRIDGMSSKNKYLGISAGFLFNREDY